MKDARGDVLYVGKAQSLRSRVRSYWQKQAPGGEIHRIRSVIDRVADVEVTEVDSVSPRRCSSRRTSSSGSSRASTSGSRTTRATRTSRSRSGDDFPRVERTRKLVERRQPLLRAVRVGVERRRVDEPRPAALPVPDLHDRHQGRRARAPAAVPAVPHQALPGAVHRGDLEGRLPRRHRAGRALPRGPPGDAGQGAPASRWRPPPSSRTTSARPSIATRSGRSSGRWRARRWPPSRARSSTWSGWRARTTRRR